MPTVIVVGGGMSGLCAGIASLEAGANVVLLEGAPAVGGSMALSGGLVWAPRDVSTARRWIPKGDERKQRILVEHVEALWEWLESLGLPLGDSEPCLKDGMGIGRTMGLGTAGDRSPFAAAMAERFEALGGELRVEAKVEGLVRGRHSGWTIHATTPSATMTEDADRVIFATGGFQNSPDLLNRWVTPYAHDILVRSNRVSNGLPLRLLPSYGAKLSRGMSSFYGHTFPDVPGSAITPDLFIPASQYYTDYCLLVNTLGLRFTDESLGVLDEHNAQQGARQPQGRYFALFDERIRQEHVLGRAGLPGIIASALPDRVALAEDLGALVLHVDTLDELLDGLGSIGLPTENVRDTLTVYNDDALAVKTFPPRGQGNLPLLEPPFHAVACVAAITYTMGGVETDDVGRAMGSPSLDGVFVTGADAGGVFEDVYGGGLAWAGVTGMLAGRAAAS